MNIMVEMNLFNPHGIQEITNVMVIAISIFTTLQKSIHTMRIIYYN